MVFGIYSTFSNSNLIDVIVLLQLIAWFKLVKLVKMD